MVGRVLQFNENEVRKCYTININNDEICENMPNENFFSNLAYDTGVQPITVIRERAEVIIDDSLEPECSKSLYTYFMLLLNNSYIHTCV